MKAYRENKLTSGTIDPSFISRGFSNWKDATVKLKAHECSNCHKEAVQKILTLPKTTQDVGETLSSIHKQEKQQRRQVLLKILSNVRFLARQALPLRGDGNETDSNFTQLLNLRGEDDPNIKEWMTKKTDKYTSPDIQNEVLRLMALKVMREIASNLHKTPFYAIMADETADCSNREQFVVCLRWVGDDLQVHEDFVGLHVIESIDSATLTAVIKDVLMRMNLTLTKMRGQCYDGASCMSGLKSGVATRLSEEEPRAIYTHCYGHALNLACSDTIKQCTLMRDALDMTHEITKLIKNSPRRDAIFGHLKEELAADTPGMRVLCPHRWTVRAESLKSILDNYEVLRQTWMESLQAVKDTEMKSRIIGVSTHMETFQYFYGVTLGEIILWHTDNLSRTLQKSDISDAQGQEVADLTVKTLQKMRTDESFDLFWKTISRKATTLDLPEPELPRRRKMPKRYETGNAESDYPTTPYAYYKAIYYEALDLIINCTKNRFNQPGYRVYRHLQDLLMKAACQQEYEAEYQFVSNFYGEDFSPHLLKTQLETFGVMFQQDLECTPTLRDIFTHLRNLSQAEKEMLSEIITLTKLVLVLPATNAISERSFSALWRVKTYLRSTMNQNRLNHLMVLHVHKTLTDSLNLIEVANEFVTGSDHRLTMFGKFGPSEI